MLSLYNGYIFPARVSQVAPVNFRLINDWAPLPDEWMPTIELDSAAPLKDVINLLLSYPEEPVYWGRVVFFAQPKHLVINVLGKRGSFPAILNPILAIVARNLRAFPLITIRYEFCLPGISFLPVDIRHGYRQATCQYQDYSDSLAPDWRMGKLSAMPHLLAQHKAVDEGWIQSLDEDGEVPY
jgi:hypothetical protein